jgi:hypothetical protein
MNKECLSRVLCLFSCLFYLIGNKKNKETLRRFKLILDFPDAGQTLGTLSIINELFSFIVSNPKFKLCTILQTSEHYIYGKESVQKGALDSNSLGSFY